MRGGNEGDDDGDTNSHDGSEGDDDEGDESDGSAGRGKAVPCRAQVLTKIFGPVPCTGVSTENFGKRFPLALGLPMTS